MVLNADVKEQNMTDIEEKETNSLAEKSAEMLPDITSRSNFINICSKCENNDWIEAAKARQNSKNSLEDKKRRYWDYCTAIDAMNKKMGVICSGEEIIKKAGNLPHCTVTNAYSKTVESTKNIVNGWNISLQTLNIYNKMMIEEQTKK